MVQVTYAQGYVLQPKAQEGMVGAIAGSEAIMRTHLLEKAGVQLQHVLNLLRQLRRCRCCPRVRCSGGRLLLGCQHPWLWWRLLGSAWLLCQQPRGTLSTQAAVSGLDNITNMHMHAAPGLQERPQSEVQHRVRLAAAASAQQAAQKTVEQVPLWRDPPAAEELPAVLSAAVAACLAAAVAALPTAALPAAAVVAAAAVSSAVSTAAAAAAQAVEVLP